MLDKVCPRSSLINWYQIIFTILLTENTWSSKLKIGLFFPENAFKICRQGQGMLCLITMDDTNLDDSFSKNAQSCCYPRSQCAFQKPCGFALERSSLSNSDNQIRHKTRESKKDQVNLFPELHFKYVSLEKSQIWDVEVLSFFRKETLHRVPSFLWIITKTAECWKFLQPFNLPLRLKCSQFFS